MRSLAIVVAIATAVVLAAPRPAHAEDIVAYQADGDAAAAASDARVAALDEAFGKAVSQALADVLEPDVRRQNKGVLDRELLGHARLWVARFTVTKEGVADDRKQVSVSVRIDRDKLRARLAELNIATRAAPEAPAPGAQSVTVLLRVVAPDGVRATYGLAAEKDVAGLTALSSALRRASLVVKRAPASGPAARAEGELPVDDDTAEALGAEAKAELACVASVAVGSPVPLRGVDASGVLVTARVRLVDRKAHRAIGQGNVVTAARGSDPGLVAYAIERALVAATADVLPQPAQELAQAQAYSGDDKPAAEPGIVLVRLARATPWGVVQSEIKHLVGARGVSKATLRHVSPSGWVIGVATGESIDRIASIVKKPPAADTSVAVKIVGDVIEATLSGAP
ncbi:MAG TPA: hypothetical protein VFK02_10835 [Kofleriaceae bacterium]|nr:hypothetical protein [Kofleriaceae bacterium]